LQYQATQQAVLYSWK